jgi:hypothetical protein
MFASREAAESAQLDGRIPQEQFDGVMAAKAIRAMQGKEETAIAIAALAH